MTCPFCSISPARVVAASDLALALRDSYPVSPGHTLIVPRRHVATWFDATPAEQAALLALLDVVRRDLDAGDPRPDGYNIGINAGEAAGQTVMHLHVHLIPRYAGDVDDPTGGVRFVIPERGNYRRRGHIPRMGGAPREDALATGGRADPFEVHLASGLAQSRDIAAVAAFVRSSGVQRLAPRLTSALERGARVRLLTGDYLEITQADALRQLLDLAQANAIRRAEDGTRGALELRVVEVDRLGDLGSSFHPKAWILHDLGLAWVGASNLTKAAITHGVEWNARIERSRDPGAFLRVEQAFEHLWGRAAAVTSAWIEAYTERARREGLAPPLGELDGDPDELPPEPRDVQLEALDALARGRAEGRTRALVVMATGLGKTWLAAFDVAQWQREQGLPRPPRTLFIAHRVEILRQAAATFRRLFPDLSVGWYAGGLAQLDAELVLGSIQKLTRHVDALPRDAFDYVIVDEVHHAAAESYRHVLNRLRPGFVLGLTATPERTDSGDILGLLDDHLAYRADIGTGIALGHLVPFAYHGLADPVNYAPIPWRNRHFDPAKLAAAVQTEDRMRSLWDAWTRHPGTRSLVFCASIAHARFAATWLRKRGVRVAVLHSGSGSDDRSGSLDALERGEIDAVCTVDLLNEGVDLPRVDRIVMLRPTESPLLFLQQLGRGLRRAPGKERCTVLDFVGNHTMFLDRVRALLDLAGAPAGSAPSDDAPVELPSGCSVHVDLAAIHLMERLLPAADGLLHAYRQRRAARGVRPRLGGLVRDGVGLTVLGKRWTTWFHLVRDEGDLSETQARVLEHLTPFLRHIERTAMPRSFEMVVLQVLIEEGALLAGLDLDTLATRSHALLLRSPELFADLEGVQALPDPRHPDPVAWRRYWRTHPVAAWKRSPWFTVADGRLVPTVDLPAALHPDLTELVAELVDYRLARYRRRRSDASRTTGERFAAQVVVSADPYLEATDAPRGELDVRTPDGAAWRFRWTGQRCRIAHPVGSMRNGLPDLLRRWFGLEPTGELQFHPAPDGWWVEPTAARLPALRAPANDVVAFPTLRAAASWTGAPQDLIEPARVRLPVRGGDDTFAVRVHGPSMDGGHAGVRDGDWLILRLSRSRGLGAVLGRVALVSREHDDGRTYHIKRVQRVDDRVVLHSDNPDHPDMDARPGDRVVATVVERVAPEQLGPPVGSAVEDVVEAFGLTEPPNGPVSRLDGHMFLCLDGPKVLASPRSLAQVVADRAPSETAFVLARTGGQGPWTYLGVGRWADGAWAIPEVDHATWRRLGRARGASRPLEARWEAAARELVASLLKRFPREAWVEVDGRRLQVRRRAARGGVVIGGEFKDRTVSLLDLGWVLAARERAGRTGRPLDETLVNELRYLDGTPKSSTRWIDTGWALRLVAALER